MGKADEVVEPGSVDELTRVLVLALRYAGAPQGALVHDLSSLGLHAPRIAELLGASGASVRAQKGQRRPDWPKLRKPDER